MQRLNSAFHNFCSRVTFSNELESFKSATGSLLIAGKVNDKQFISLFHCLLYWGLKPVTHKFAGVQAEFLTNLLPRPSYYQKQTLDEKSLNLILQTPNLSLQLRRLVGGDRGRDNSAGHATGTTKGDLRGDENVGDVLVFAEEWKMKEDFEGGGIGGENNEFGNTAVECFGCCGEV